tara:strand:- start:481 stop:1065 length:585 start_codon:yes stop_codon:yes gene_type:complete
MIKIGIVGEIGSGKTFFSKLFKFPIFDADKVVSNLYKEDQNLFRQIKRKFPKEISSFPLRKEELLKIILKQSKNLKVLGKMIHPKVRKKMNNFLKINKKKKIVILDVPLLLENKLNTKKDVIIFIEGDKKKIKQKIKKRKNINLKLINILKQNQIPLKFKKKKADFIIKNNFISKTAKKNVKLILEIINERDRT